MRVDHQLNVNGVTVKRILYLVNQYSIIYICMQKKRIKSTVFACVGTKYTTQLNLD